MSREIKLYQIEEIKTKINEPPYDLTIRDFYLLISEKKYYMIWVKRKLISKTIVIRLNLNIEIESIINWVNEQWIQPTLRYTLENLLQKSKQLNPYQFLTHEDKFLRETIQYALSKSRTITHT